VKSKTVLLSSVLSSVAASICCIVPVVAIMFGLGAFGLSTWLEALRPHLLVLAALLLAAAFFLTYRRNVVRCEDTICRPGRPSRMPLWLVASVVVAVSAFPYYSGAVLKAQTQGSITPGDRKPSADQASVVIGVSGMTCGSCSAHIQGALLKTPGVKSADVSYEKARATVSYDPKTIDVESIRALIEAIGYKAGEVERSEPQPGAGTAKPIPGLSVNELKQGFNRLSDKVRVVALLSPTCDACRRGRGVVGQLFNNQASENLAGLVVWLPMKPKDSRQAAYLESENLTDERISVRGWDIERQIGDLFAKSLRLSSTAWDVYLVYASGIKWEGNQPPKPSYWMHQLQGQRADRMLCLNPAALSAQVERFLAQGSKAAKSQVDSGQLGFYAVPLVCRAAPEIGCGSRAKPILQELERNPAVAQAWLNRAGTVIAVLWTKVSTVAERAETITASAKKSDLAIRELKGFKRETALKEFDSKMNWYRSSEVDSLSEEEADIIAARLVRRVAARITLSGEQSGELRKALTDAFKRIILGTREKSVPSLEEEFLIAGRKHLSEEGVAALKHALSLGIRPLPAEK
jgi:copper chaperone CopZ